ncbi:homocysteine S-methyltransferase [Pullulanibacillus pueri]|uniref:Bifunctional homocysteine S-methyltransferase/methylenetetrahydrofolate reductase n=1 Tax=Pullulanibacillus pueri TaxID=1437324 RepID=A0A8J2ZVW7_9BACL|nr:bifunctional homocysteine S-methyltransferase/methylenetetrahydrofolate reductase [Pullulanibacillus pueri]MBM7682599.1 homocysteine S-methyltransferase [Pullulanibacillus pueri]GGH82457.1 bifunctional homocysteine S-methyltransferase/methylenetetrahydrofolate reductase [Pullulanibacillus pueri]
MSKERRTQFLEQLKTDYIIGDGAMATLLHQSGVPARTCFEALVLNQPELVQEAHMAYLSAGATLIQTNTFSGHRMGLGRYGLEDRVWEINHSAVKAARQAIQLHQDHLQINNVTHSEAFVFGTIGSTADIKVPNFNSQGARMSLKFLFEEQLTALLEASVDGLLLETFSDLTELQLAVETARQFTNLPIIANLSPEAIGVTRDGFPIDEAFSILEDAGADVVGLNCRLGLSGILRSYESLELNPHSHYAAVPNGGLLHMVDGEYSYTGNANYFAKIGLQLVQKGVKFIGGCCGTTPDHIRALAKQLKDFSHSKATAEPTLSHVSIQKPIQVRSRTLEPKMPTDKWDQESLNVIPQQSLVQKAKHEPTIIVELDPPKVLDVTKYINAAEKLHQAGADAITIADNSLGTVRVSNMAIASQLKNRGIEPLVHIACRDRNLIGQQSHLMGLHVLGIHHILLVTGDPSRFGDLPGATSVYDMSSTDLSKMVKKLNHGVAFSGQPLKQSATFVIGTSFNPHVRNFNKAIDRLKRKLDAGADYVMTQPIFDIQLFEKLARAVEPFNVPVFVGIMPLTSSRNAQFLHNEVPGIQIPDSILERMDKDSNKEAALEGLSISETLINEALNYFNGIYLVTPFLRYDLTSHLTRYIHGLKKTVKG